MPNFVDICGFLLSKNQKKTNFHFEYKRAHYFEYIQDISQAIFQHGNMSNWSRSPEKKTFIS